MRHRGGTDWREAIPRGVGIGVVWVAVALSSGCVTVYQPLTSLQQPVVVDPEVANFPGLRLLVRCHAGDYLDTSDAQTLCRNVGTLFRNQGAQVELEVPRAGRSGRDREEGAKPDLIVDLKARLLHEEDSAVLRVLSVFTWTLVPTIHEFTMAQDVSIRDGSGSLLVSDSLQGRFIEYMGVGVWGVNFALDLAVRPYEEEFTGDAPKREFSRDFYGQLNQLVFNARMRSLVLRGFEQRTPAAPARAPTQAIAE